VLPRGRISNRCSLNVSFDSRWLKRSVRLSGLGSFCEVVRSMSRQRKMDRGRRKSRRKGWLSKEAKESIAASQRARWAMWRRSKVKLLGSNSR
jgi:hypothetical protein